MWSHAITSSLMLLLEGACSVLFYEYLYIYAYLPVPYVSCCRSLKIATMSAWNDCCYLLIKVFSSKKENKSHKETGHNCY